MTKTTTIRYRWGIQHDWAQQGERPRWRTLGAGWMIDRIEVEHLDFWPASFETRHRARQEVKALTAKAAKHSTGWRFREIKLELRTRELAGRRA